MSLGELAAQKQARSEQELTMEEALDEVIADGCEMMLRRGSVMEQMAEEKPGLYKLVKSWIKKWLQGVQEAFQGVQAVHEEARAVETMEAQRLQEFAELWYKGLFEASERAAKSPAKEGGETKYSYAGERAGTADLGQKSIRSSKDVVDAGEDPGEALLHDAQALGRIDANKNAASEGGEKYSYKGLPADAFYKDGRIYDYDFLTAQKPMEVCDMPPMPARSESFAEIRKKALSSGENNLSKAGEKDEDIYKVVNSYTKRNINVGKKTLRHSLKADKRSELIVKSRLISIAGDLVKNAIPINGLIKENQQAEGTYAMLAIAKSNDATFAAIITVDQFSNVTSVEQFDVAHAINGRIKREDWSSSKDQPLGKNSYGLPQSSVMSIAQVLDVVNETHRGILSEDVLNHYEEERPEGYYSKRVLFQNREELPEDRELLMAAKAEGKNAEALQAYQKKVKELEALQRKLQRQRDELAQAKGRAQVPQSSTETEAKAEKNAAKIEETKKRIEEIQGRLEEMYAQKEAYEKSQAEYGKKLGEASFKNFQAFKESQEQKEKRKEKREENKERNKQIRETLKEFNQLKKALEEYQREDKTIAENQAAKEKKEISQAAITGWMNQIQKTEASILRAEKALDAMERSPALRTEAEKALAAWREANPNEAARAIREMRQEQESLRARVKLLREEARLTTPETRRMLPSDVNRMAQALEKSAKSNELREILQNERDRMGSVLLAKIERSECIRVAVAASEKRKPARCHLERSEAESKALLHFPLW